MANKILTRLNFLIFASLVLLNLVGVFMPELSFDALWYHLTLSKLFLAKGQWYFSGGLFYYSVMPRLAEVISLPLFSIIGYIGPKLTQFVSGLVVSLVIYRLANRFTKDRLLALIGVNLFYATWLVSWQSSSGYVDLVRTAFESVALYLLFKKSILTSSRKVLAGVALGLAVGTKWHALGSLLIIGLSVAPIVVPIALVVALPWFSIAYYFTNNPVYPLLEPFMHQTQLSQVNPDYYSPFWIISRLLSAPLFLTRPSEDFLSPSAGIIYLLSLLGLVSSNSQIRRLSVIGLLGTFLLLLTPPPSTRYFLPFFPAMIISCVYILSRMKASISRFLVVLFTVSAMIILILRLGSYLKYLPLISGQLSQNQFLASLSYRLPDTFIDADDYVAKSLPKDARYLIGNNLHNLYYFPYDFDHISFADDKVYDYYITSEEKPETVKGELIHINPLGIQIFKL